MTASTETLAPATEITQKTLVKLLDRAAARAARPASSKQTWFLAGLIAKSNSASADYNDWSTNGQPLSMSEASSLIDFYLNAR